MIIGLLNTLRTPHTRQLECIRFMSGILQQKKILLYFSPTQKQFITLALNCLIIQYNIVIDIIKENMQYKKIFSD